MYLTIFHLIVLSFKQYSNVHFKVCYKSNTINCIHVAYQKIICLFNPLHKASLLLLLFVKKHVIFLFPAHREHSEGFSQRYNMIELKQMAITHPISDCSPKIPCILLVFICPQSLRACAYIDLYAKCCKKAYVCMFKVFTSLWGL